MKSIAYRRTILILLVVITWITLSFIIQNRELLFDDVSVNGETKITLKIVSNVDIEDIKEMIYQVSQQRVQNIDVHEDTARNRIAVVKIAFLDYVKTQDLGSRLQQNLYKEVEVLSISSIGGRISLEFRYKLYIALGIASIIIISLLVLFIKAIKKVNIGEKEH